MEIIYSSYGAVVINKPFRGQEDLQWFTDNQNVVSIVSKGSTKTVLQKLVLDIFSTCFKYNINIDIV